MPSSEFQFLSLDAKKLEEEMVAAYERRTGKSVSPASPEKLMMQWVAAIVLQERLMTNYTANQNIPSRAEGENLDALGELFYLTERPKAQCAVCTERFYISQPQGTAVLIPAGTRVTDASAALVWETAEDVYVPAGETYADTQVRCQTAGVVGNGYVPGQLNKAVDIYDYYSGCENITESDDGADMATDEEYYHLLRSSMDSLSTAGPEGAYVYHAKRVSTQIADVKAVRPAETVRKTLEIYQRDGKEYAFFPYGVENLRLFAGETEAQEGTDYTLEKKDGLVRLCMTPGGALEAAETIEAEVRQVKAGYVYIYLMMQNGEMATTEMKNAVLKACSGDTVRPMTDRVEVHDPEIVRYDIDLTYYVRRGESAAAVSEAVEQAVAEYTAWQSGKIGRDINPSKLHGLLMGAGVKRLELNAPVFTKLRSGAEGDTPQLAAVGEIRTVNGGYEDE